MQNNWSENRFLCQLIREQLPIKMEFGFRLCISSERASLAAVAL
jgi:hypothetical protein